ncbi:hypothetical protein D9M68_833600 [compost metagenome]
MQVDGDQVAVVEQAQRAAIGRLGRSLSDHQALVDQARQLALGDDGDVVDQAKAIEREHHRRGHGHAGAALDAQATQHQHAAALDAAFSDAAQRLVAAVANHGGAT